MIIAQAYLIFTLSSLPSICLLLSTPIYASTPVRPYNPSIPIMANQAGCQSAGCPYSTFISRPSPGGMSYVPYGQFMSAMSIALYNAYNHSVTLHTSSGMLLSP